MPIYITHIYIKKKQMTSKGANEKSGHQYYKMQDNSQQFGEKVTTSGNCYLRKCQLA